jgi:tetratricopeptide (TPR) repeat protein
VDERLDQSELDALWNFDDPIASAARFAQAAAEDDRTEAERAELETQRARALGLQQRFDEADALLDSLGPALGVLDVRIQLERGRLRRSEGRIEEAVRLFDEAAVRARRVGDLFLTVDALHMLAIADPERSAQWTAEGLAALETSSDPRTLRWAVSLHNNRGWALIGESSPAEALEELVLARESAIVVGTDDQRFWADWSVAHALRLVGRVEEAAAIQHRLQAERPEDLDVAAELAALTDVAPTIEP